MATVEIIKNTQKSLVSKRSSEILGMSSKDIRKLLLDYNWKERFTGLVEAGEFSSTALLDELRPVMENFGEEPEDGWLASICNEIKAQMYPENFKKKADAGQRRAEYFYLENYRALLKCEQKIKGYSPTDHINFMDDSEVKNCATFEEYKMMKELWDRDYILEFMRINREITPFNTIGHIGGVHHVAVFVGKQLIDTDIPVDIALVSGAAASHDLGKFGCSDKETKRIPYLHYYYTDEILRKENMPMMAHIASNHSTWDLELENLSVESLLLIYADFRVKSTRENGVEIIHFYTLAESFDVILSKLDNVDEKKRHRYEKVYAKLKDFEDYLIDIGVETDPFKEPSANVDTDHGDIALLMGEEVVDHIKYAAMEHNLKIMGIFNNEYEFASLIEAARSEKQWKSQRAYLNILTEYFTYMTKKEKQLTLNFLYELLSHREGDIRRQAGRLMGCIIAKYDDVYRKEIPSGAVNDWFESFEAVNIWENYLNKIVFPSHRVTDQHRSWIGYTLKVVLQGLIENADDSKIDDFLAKYFRLFEYTKVRDSSVFVLLDSIITLPYEYISHGNVIRVLEFVDSVADRDAIEIRIGCLRVVEYLAERFRSDYVKSFAASIIEKAYGPDLNISVINLVYKMLKNLGNKEGAETYNRKIEMLKESGMFADSVSALFRENLKTDTPWVVKVVNIEFLLEEALAGKMDDQKFYLATHLANLVKVSEKVTVRHRAGNGLLKIAETLPIEQVNEISVELSKGLELGEYQFSKYIPEYLGGIALHLHPNEFLEFIDSLEEQIEGANDKVGSVCMDTIGEVLKNYSKYKYRDQQSEEEYEARKQRLLGMLLKGIANYQEGISEEAIMVVGQSLFGSDALTRDEKFSIFRHIYKKFLTLINSVDDYGMNFFTNAATLNNIYRFILDYNFTYGEMDLPQNNKIAFFPGTFDPFSLSHKGIVQAIRDDGFEVYLAIDEFSWSKKTQPRMIRRQIIFMSVAGEPDVYLFADDFPINIANPVDLKRLKELFPGKEVYMVAGSDVIINASSYKAAPVENSIHSMNHIIFARQTDENEEHGRVALEEAYKNISGEIRELKLPVYLEDISSTRIRENIDSGRDISKLIDPVAQNFIYENSLYLREPQYKSIFEIKDIAVGGLKRRSSNVIYDMEDALAEQGCNINVIKRYIDRPDVVTAVVADEDNRICAVAAVHELDSSRLYSEFNDLEIASYLRRKVTGRVLVVRGVYCTKESDIMNVLQILLTEVFSKFVEEEVTYAIYHPLESHLRNEVIEELSLHGFTEIEIRGDKKHIYEVNMREPMVLIENMDTALKQPFNTNERILAVIQKTHRRMQKALTKLNPGNLVLSFNAGIMHQKIVNMVTESNGVPNYPTSPRVLGECMCVPFGKILREMAVPNTVTKTLHTEKVFSTTLDTFTIKEAPMYSTIQNQVRTIKSFNRPVILVDDVLHRGHRMRALDPVFKETGLEIKKLIMGVVSGNGKDLMEMQGREVQSAYFIPNLKAWFVESTLCPFIGGDGIERNDRIEANLIPSINQILPFASPTYLRDSSKESIYEFSMTALENAADIFEVLEEEYQIVFERKFTVRRLSDAIKSPCMPNGADRVAVDLNKPPSVYIEDYIEKLLRLESSLK